MPSVARNPGVMVERTPMVRSLTGGKGRPSTAAGERVLPWSAAGRFEAAARWSRRGAFSIFRLRSGKTKRGAPHQDRSQVASRRKMVVMPRALKPGRCFGDGESCQPTRPRQRTARAKARLRRSTVRRGAGPPGDRCCHAMNPSTNRWDRSARRVTQAPGPGRRRSGAKGRRRREGHSHRARSRRRAG